MGVRQLLLAPFDSIISFSFADAAKDGALSCFRAWRNSPRPLVVRPFACFPAVSCGLLPLARAALSRRPSPSFACATRLPYPLSPSPAQLLGPLVLFCLTRPRPFLRAFLARAEPDLLTANLTTLVIATRLTTPGRSNLLAHRSRPVPPFSRHLQFVPLYSTPLVAAHWLSLPHGALAAYRSRGWAPASPCVARRIREGAGPRGRVRAARKGKAAWTRPSLAATS